MRLFHLSDLHLGIKLYEQSLIEDQKYILDKILSAVDKYEPDGIILAGDIYDKSVPSNEATALLNDFLAGLVQRKKEVYMISGNHDSSERLAFGEGIFEQSGLHISPVFNGEIKNITFKDAYGDVNIYLLPFVKPSHVRQAYKTEENDMEDIHDDHHAVEYVINQMQIDTSKRNVLVAHQFVTGAHVDDQGSEINVGLSGNVGYELFEDFDYVALGHIHNPQNIKDQHIRYSGTPLKYSFSEANQDKSITMIDLNEKGNIKYEYIPLKPLRDMHKIKGTYNDLTLKPFLETLNLNDYYQITLTDEDTILNAFYRLRVDYPYLLNLQFENSKTVHNSEMTGAQIEKEKTSIEYVQEFFLNQIGKELTEEQLELCQKLLEDK